MPRFKYALLACTLLAATPIIAVSGMAMAQRMPTYDPAQLPEMKGKVAQYSLTPRGEVDGLILTDGTEVHVPPFMSTQVVTTVKPGDAVTIHGLKARAVAMIAAASLTNDATGATVNMRQGHGPQAMGTALDVTGKIKSQLHQPRGEVNGVLLEDGTIVRMPPQEATKLAATLAVGASVTVHGEGYAGPLGKVVAARDIGPDAAHLTHIEAPGRGEHRHGMMRGEHMRGGPGMQQRP